MHVVWNFYTAQGRAEGLSSLNICIDYIGSKNECQQVIPEIARVSAAYTYSVRPSKTQKGKYVVLCQWNGFYD
jgi:hypothetical protein